MTNSSKEKPVSKKIKISKVYTKLVIQVRFVR